MDELKELIEVTITDIIFDVSVKATGVTFDEDRPCLASVHLQYENECVSSGGYVYSAPFCTALCHYNAAIFVDAVRETVSKALVKGEK